MALQIIWTAAAKEHLNEILFYWYQRNGTKYFSRKLYKTIKNALKILAKYPESGKKSENSEIRVKIIKDYYFFYKFDSSHLFVVGFCDMRRDTEFIGTLLT